MCRGLGGGTRGGELLEHHRKNITPLSRIGGGFDSQIEAASSRSGEVHLNNRYVRRPKKIVKKRSHSYVKAYLCSAAGNPDADVHPSVGAHHTGAKPRKLGLWRAHDTLYQRIRTLLSDFREQ